MEDETTFLLPKINYKKKGTGEITDTTGKLDAEIITTWTDEGLTKMLEMEPLDKTLKRLAKGHDLYHVHLRKKGDSIGIGQFSQEPYPFSQKQGMDYVKNSHLCLGAY